MKRIKFSVSFYEAGDEKFKAGEHYPADDTEAQRCVVRGIAEEIEVADTVAETGGDAPADKATGSDAAAVERPAAKAKK